MKWPFYTILIACITVVYMNATSGSQQAIFEQANNLYHAQQYDQARALYETLDNNCPARSNVWFNIGNCWYHAGNVARALACWERADRNASYAQRVMNAHNRSLVCQEPLQTGVVYTVRMMWQAVVERLLSVMPLIGIQCLFLLCWCGVVLMSLRERKRGYHVLIFLVVIGLTALTGHAWIQEYRVRTTRYAIVQKDTLLYAGPDVRYQQFGPLSTKTRVRIMANKPSWTQVRDTDNRIGWVLSDDIIEV